MNELFMAPFAEKPAFNLKKSAGRCIIKTEFLSATIGDETKKNRIAEGMLPEEQRRKRK